MKTRLTFMALAILGIAGVLISGLFVIPPGEAAVVRRLGKVLPRPREPGLHWAWPLGLDQVTRVRTEEVRRLAIGRADTAGPDDDPSVGEFLTGDLNLLRARAVVQYRVADPTAFVLRSGNADRLLERLAESSLTRALARQGIDLALRSGRAELALDVADDLARSVERHGLGLRILGVSLTDARPPIEVQPDFAAAQAAQSDHDRRLFEAETYGKTTRIAARAEALARVEQAKTRASRVTALARGRADHFRSLLVEAKEARPLTVARLYRDALRDLLPRVRRKLVLTPDEPIDLSILGAGP
ncbi:MAG: protease modulator HflK [Isosphaeraceae bacterium]